MSNAAEVSTVYSPDGQWFWTGQEWVPAPPTANTFPTANKVPTANTVPTAPLIVREQKSVGQQVGNGVAMFGLIVVVIVMVIVAINIAASV